MGRFLGTVLTVGLLLAAVGFSQGPVVIQFSTWEAGALADYWPAKEAEFEAANPDIDIELLVNPDQYEPKLFTLIAAGSTPDVMQLFEVTAPILAQRGNILDLRPIINSDPTFDESDFIRSTLQLAEYAGGLYGFGSDVNPQIMYYNIDLFEQAGVALPAAGWTWDDLFAAAQAITRDTDGDGRPNQWGVGWWWLPTGAWWVPATIQIWNNGGELYNTDFTRTLLDQPVDYEALQWWADLINVSHVSPNASDIGGSNVNALFQQGRLGMYLDGTWNTGNFQTVPFRWDVAAIPGNVRETTVLHASYYAISSTTQNPDAAWRWLKFIVAPEAQTFRSNLLRYLPTRQSVNAVAPYARTDIPPANIALVGNVLPTARMLPAPPNANRIVQVFERELTLIYLGEKTAQQAMADAAAEINELLRQ